MTKKILIALPAFNEAKHINNVLKSVVSHQLDVLLVDDGSTDETISLASEFNIEIIHHNRNLGLSEVYKTFINYGISHEYTHLITLDSDGQHDALHIPDYVDLLDSHQIIFGNRFSQPETIPPEKLSSNFFASWLTHSMYGHFLPDVSCGFRAFSLDFLKSLHLTSKGYGIIYQTVFECLKREILPAYIPMQANYNRRLLNTNSEEITNLLEQAQRYNTKANFDGIIRKVKKGIPFIIDFSDIQFKFDPSGESAFVISTDINKAKNYYI